MKKRMSRKDWQLDERNTNYIVVALMILLGAIVTCGIVSGLSILATFLS